MRTCDGVSEVVKRGILTTFAVVSTEVGSGMFVNEAESVRGYHLSCKGEERLSNLGVLASAATCPGTKTPWLRERLAGSMLQQAQLHGKR